MPPGEWILTNLLNTTAQSYEMVSVEIHSPGGIVVVKFKLTLNRKQFIFSFIV